MSIKTEILTMLKILNIPLNYKNNSQKSPKSAKNMQKTACNEIFNMYDFNIENFIKETNVKRRHRI